jgi:hypothetical protein
VTTVGGLPAAITVTAPSGSVSAAVIDRTAVAMTLQLLDFEVTVQPGTVRVLVSGGPSAGTAYFFLGGSSTHFATAGLDEGGGASLTLSLPSMPTGPNVVRVGATSVAPTLTDDNSDAFTVSGAPPPPDEVFTPQVPPMPPEAPVNHWVFQGADFSNNNAVAVYTLPVNPSAVQMSFGEFVIDHEATTVSNGRLVAWEGAPAPNIWRWNGFVLDKQQHDALMAIGTTGQRLWLTDHLRRRYLVKIATCSLQRKRDIERPWLHTYEMTAWILSGEGVVV